MRCPRCGSSDLRQETGGWWFCRGEVEEIVADPSSPGGARPIWDPCKHRFWDRVSASREDENAFLATGAPGLGVCACGTIAIRTCRRCKTPLCAERKVCSFQRGRDWFCRNCSVVHDQEKSQREYDAGLAKKAAVLSQYRALPTVSRAELKSVIAGERRDVVDGQTHQLDTWTNREMAALACGYLGVEEITLTPGGGNRNTSPEGTLGQRIVLTADGRKFYTSQKHHDGSGGERSKELAGPDEKFNASLTALTSESYDPKWLQCLAAAKSRTQVDLATEERGRQDRLEHQRWTKSNEGSGAGCIIAIALFLLAWIVIAIVLAT